MNSNKNETFSSIETIIKTHQFQKIENQLSHEQFKIDNKKIIEFFEDINHMKIFLKDGCENFNNEFELLNFINSGSRGVIFQATYKKKPKKKISLKFLLTKKSQEKREKSKKIKNRESLFLMKLHQKNIIKFYGYYTIKDYSCIALEYAKYGDLVNFQNIFFNEFIPEKILSYFTVQILKGLYYCHKNKIAHLDIKPRNILIDKNFNVKITDFGCSFNYKKITNKKIIPPFRGTPIFMAPEIIKKIEINIENFNKIDIYSLGVLLYKTAYGFYPYEIEYSDRKNYDDQYKKIMENKLIFIYLDKYSVLFQNFVKGLLNKNIKERYSIIDALKDPWVKDAKLIYEEEGKNSDKEKFLSLLSDQEKEEMIERKNKLRNYHKKNNLNNTANTANDKNN